MDIYKDPFEKSNRKKLAARPRLLEPEVDSEEEIEDIVKDALISEEGLSNCCGVSFIHSDMDICSRCKEHAQAYTTVKIGRGSYGDMFYVDVDFDPCTKDVLDISAAYS